MKRYIKEDEITARSDISVEDDGSIFINAGSIGNLVTQLGTSESKFRPHIDKIENTIFLYTYFYSKEFIPANFEGVNEFLEILESQASNNTYIQNYLRLSAEKMSNYLTKMSLIDDKTTFVVINNGSNILANYVEYFRENFDNIYDDIIFVKPEINEDELYISENVPKQEEKYLKDILEELQKVDAHLTLDDVNLDKYLYRYLRGFLDVKPNNLKNIDGNIIFISDFYSNAFLAMEAKEHIKKIIGEDVRLSIMVGKKDT